MVHRECVESHVTCELSINFKCMTYMFYSIFQVQGRLGNKMWSYATLLAAKHKYGYRVFMEESDLENLSYFFKNIDQVEPVERLCNGTNYPWYSLTETLQVLKEDQFRYGRLLEIGKKLRLLANNVNLKNGWHILMQDYEPEVRRAFTFRNHFVQGAEKRIGRYTNMLKEKHKALKKAKEIIYVGIHIRLRDAKRDIVIPFGLPDLTVSQYISAMSMVVDKLEAKRRKVIFIVITDDPLQVQDKIMPRIKNKFYVKQAGTGHVNNRLSIGLDLAMMSKCNYTILSYGTFSFWSGFLGGGPKILPVHYHYGHTYWINGAPERHQDPFLLTDIQMPFK